MIKEPTYTLDTSSSCMNLIFTSQPNFMTESGVHSSLHSNCQYNVEIIYPPPYVREVWHYKDAYTELIRQVINWQRLFLKTNVNGK